MTEFDNPFNQAMMNVAGELVDLTESAQNAVNGPNPPEEWGREQMKDKAAWNKDWANKTPFQRQMEIDEQGQDTILKNVNGYVGRA